MGVRTFAGDADSSGQNDAAILRSLRPKWVDRGKLERRVANDTWIKKIKAQREAKAAEPLPSQEEAHRLWLAVQIALAAWLPIHFAAAYRQMELRKLDEKARRRALAIQEKMQRERVNSLRGTIGLHHLKKLGTGVGQRRSRFRERLPRQTATGAQPPQSSA